MSMISIKNFVSPFTNTVHAVTIILITVLFAFFRLQGGGVSISSSHNKEIRIESRKPVIETENDSAGLDSLIKNDNLDVQISKPRTADSKPQAIKENSLPKIADSGTIEIPEDQGDDLIKQMIGKKPLEDTSNKPVKAEHKKGSEGGLDEIEKSLGMR